MIPLYWLLDFHRDLLNLASFFVPRPLPVSRLYFWNWILYLTARPLLALPAWPRLWLILSSRTFILDLNWTECLHNPHSSVAFISSRECVRWIGHPLHLPYRERAGWSFHTKCFLSYPTLELCGSLGIYHPTCDDITCFHFLMNPRINIVNFPCRLAIPPWNCDCLGQLLSSSE